MILKIVPQIFHKDVARFIYFADGVYKNYTYKKNYLEQLGIQVISGNSHIGYNLYSDEEPSVIYTFFLVIPAPFKIGKVPYYPRYRALNPFQRYQYIKFLQNPYQESDVGFCYLLLYCLERRLYEGDESTLEVIKKLADFHGGKFACRCYTTIRLYNRWKAGCLYPQNTRVYANYTLYVGCYDSKSN